MKQHVYQHRNERNFDVGNWVFLWLHTYKQMSLKKSIYEKEILEILHALKRWRPYLMGRHFKVKENHGSLKQFLEQRLYS